MQSKEIKVGTTIWVVKHKQDDKLLKGGMFVNRIDAEKDFSNISPDYQDEYEVVPIYTYDARKKLKIKRTK